jgi:hypothetical protein
MSDRLSRLRTAIARLSLDQARQLYAALGELIQAREAAAANQHREVVESQSTAKAVYQLERVRCGKAGCKCAGENGELHGPYWYAYWRDDGKLRSTYIGKKLNLDKPLR